MNLSELKLGQTAQVRGVESINETLCRELHEIGFTPGTEVTFVSKGLFGSPLAYSFRGATFALRKHEAEAILV